MNDRWREANAKCLELARRIYARQNAGEVLTEDDADMVEYRRQGQLRQAEVDAPAKNFHLHLDACKQCREQPFNLCAGGARLLRAAVEGDRGDVAVRGRFADAEACPFCDFTVYLSEPRCPACGNALARGAGQ